MEEQVYDSLQVLRDIQDATLENYDTDTNRHFHQTFLKTCSGILDKYLREIFKDDYLYSGISYRSDDGSVELVEDQSRLGYYFGDRCSDSFKEKVNIIFEKAKSKKTINLTNVLLKAKPPFDYYFLFGSSEDAYNKVWSQTPARCYDKYFLIDKLEYKEKLEDFISLDKEAGQQNRKIINDFIDIFKGLQTVDFEKIADYLYNYRVLAKQYQDDFNDTNYVLHLISPGGITEFQYNLLLSLATKRPLTREEHANINFILYRIVSQTAIEKIKEAEQLSAINMVNYSVHKIKTELNFRVRRHASNLLHLVKVEDRKYCTALINAIDTTIKRASFVNIISKIAENKPMSEVIADLSREEIGQLIKKGKNLGHYNMIEQLNERIREHNKKNTGKLLNEANGSCNIPFTFLSKEDFYLSEEFYDSLCDTIIENFNHHAVTKSHDNIMNLAFTKNELNISNEIREELTGNNETHNSNKHKLTGNLGALKAILNFLKIATIDTNVENNYYVLTIKAINDE